MLKKGKVLDQIPAGNFYPSIHDAILHIYKQEQKASVTHIVPWFLVLKGA